MSGQARDTGEGTRPRGRVLAATPDELLERAVEWLEGLPEGLERHGQVLCASPLLRHRLRALVAVERDRPGLLLGVRLTSPGRFARQVLAAAGEPATLGAEAVRRLRLREALRDPRPLRLGYFEPGQVAREQGYVEAFARTIAALEQAGLTPRLLWEAARGLAGTDAARAQDVARIWGAVEGHQGHTDASAWRRAAELINPVDHATPTLVLSTETPGPSLAVFLQALNPELVVHLDARPDSPSVARRLAPLGLPARPPVRALAPEPTELARLQDRLFSPGGGTGPGYDGTVEIEAYASVEEELEAAVAWIVEEVARGTELGRIALVIPQVELLGGLVLDRLARSEPPVPAFLAAGLPRGETPAGARVVALLDALASGLEAESTLRLLPWLAVEAPEGVEVEELAPSRAAEVVYGAGILGGTSRDLAGGLEWTARLERRRQELRARLKAGAEPPGSTSRRKVDRWLADVEPRLPAIAALEGLLRRVAEDEASLDALVPELLTFIARTMPLPRAPEGLFEQVMVDFERLALDPSARRLRGRAALAALRAAVVQARSLVGRLDEGVFVGTARHCAGVSFDAVRVLGLCEGVFPRMPHDDPVLPSDLRARLETRVARGGPGRIIRRIEDDLDDDLHTFSRLVAGVQGRLALSLSGQWLDRTERAMSGLVLEVLNALGASIEHEDGDRWSLGHLHSGRLRPGVERLRAVALTQGATPRAGFAARRARYEADGHIPPSWLPEHELALFAAVDTPQAAEVIPGLVPEAPLSPSWLGMLLRCPFQFLQEKVLDRTPPDSRPPTDRLEPRAFGTLVHAAAEAFFIAHGQGLCAGEGSLDGHLATARDVLEDTFERTRGTYPLRGGDTSSRELERAWRVFSEVVRREWAMPPRQFVAVELGFGFDAPVGLTVDGQWPATLYLRGRIDRLDRVEGGLSVRDLKTSRGRSLREEALNVRRDLQLGLYTRALEDVLMPDVPVVEAAYTYPDGVGSPSRVLAGEDLEALRARTQGWLEVAAGLLQTRVFPRTTSKQDCRWCAFRPLCGADAAERSARALEGIEVPALVAFARMKETEDV